MLVCRMGLEAIKPGSKEASWNVEVNCGSGNGKEYTDSRKLVADWICRGQQGVKGSNNEKFPNMLSRRH